MRIWGGDISGNGNHFRVLGRMMSFQAFFIHWGNNIGWAIDFTIWRLRKFMGFKSTRRFRSRFVCPVKVKLGKSGVVLGQGE